MVEFDVEYMIEIIEEHCANVDNKFMEWDGTNPENLIDSFLGEEKECMRFLANEDYCFIHDCDDYELMYYYLMWRINLAARMPDDEDTVFVSALREYCPYYHNKGYDISDCILPVKVEEEWIQDSFEREVEYMDF